MKASIKAVSYYLPPKTESSEELSRLFPEWSADKIADKTGINERHIAEWSTCASDLGVESAKLLFAEHKVKPADVDFLLFCTQSPDYFLPTTACLIQERLGIPNTAGALDYNLGCSGFVYGLGLATGLIESGQARNVLLLNSDTYSKFISPKDKSARSIFGDGASATLIGASESASIGPFVYGTDGAGGKHLIVRNGGMRNRGASLASASLVDEFGNMQDDNHLFMNGPEVFNFALRVVPGLVMSLREKARVDDDNVDLYIFHQANKYMLDVLRRKLRIAPEKFCEHLAACGNTVSATIPIALHHAIKEGRVAQGSHLMLVGFGVGLSWSACMVQL